jgi:septal ring factor EnvC (AmiA/AmiB activator)
MSNIRDSLKTITSELKILKTDLNDVQQVILTLKTDLHDVQTTIKPFPKTIHHIEQKLTQVHEESNSRIDILNKQLI